MSGSSNWSSAPGRAPTVVIVSNGAPAGGGGSRPPASRDRHRAHSQGLYVWIVMSLLVASTALAVYDLYLLMSALTGTA